MANAQTADLTKYPGDAGYPCPFCGAKDSTDSLDEDTGPYGPDGQYEIHEKWSCGACDKTWDAIFTFSRLEVR
jgi:hypothetical protein